MTDTIQPRYIPVSRAFELMSVGRTKGYRLIREGAIVARKLGRNVYVDWHSVEQMFEALPSLVPISRQRLLAAHDLGLDDDAEPVPPEQS